jgi:AAA domain
MPPAEMSVASPDPIETSYLSSQQSDDHDASMNDENHDDRSVLNLTGEIQISSKAISRRKRGKPPLSNVEDSEEEKEKAPIPAKKRRGNNDNEESSEDEDVLEKENNGHRHVDRRNTKRRNAPSPSASSPNINAALQGQRNVNVVGKPPEAGIILKIYVENFMCHRKLTVDLCRNVNFIYGQNGSGKVRAFHVVPIASLLVYHRSHLIAHLSSTPHSLLFWLPSKFVWVPGPVELIGPAT